MTRIAGYNFDETSGVALEASGNSAFDLTLASPAQRTSSGHTNGGLTQSSAGIVTGPPALLTALMTANRSVCAWVKETTSVTGWLAECHVSSIDSGSWGILFLSGQWHIQARNTSGFVRASVSRPTDSLFHHVAGTYDGTNVRLYLDSTLVSTQPLTSPIRTDATTFRLQDQSSSAVTMDDLQFFNTALTQPEIAAIMAAPVTNGRSGKPKVWSGSAWVPHPAKTWNGSAWVTHAMKGYDGTAWVPSK